LRTFGSFYLEKLRKMAQKGREYRSKVDKLEKENEKVVWGVRTPTKVADVDSTAQSPAPSEMAESELPSINTVDDYMSWMYGNKETRAPAHTTATESAEPEITGVDDYMSWMYKDRKV
jgi:hypothetical protein